MQLLRRLIRIIHSRLQVGGDEDPLNTHYRWEQYAEEADEQANGAPKSEPFEKGPDATFAGYYANLEVPYGSNLTTVRRAWKRLVKKYHPDIHSHDPEKRRIANELMQGLNHAYEKLSEHLKK